MNIIVILSDSLRQDHLGCYGNDWIETPYIDRLAERSIRFTNAYPEALPTIPIRASLFTGQRTLPFRPWRPLNEEDITAAEIFKRHSYTTVIIGDNYHLCKPGMNYHKGFDAFQWIRGQEGDAFRTATGSHNLDDYIKPEMRDSRVAQVLLPQYLKNIEGREDETDYSAAQVARTAITWLETNDQEPFFLWVEFFDPHEPWDPPPPFDRRYTDPNYRGKKLIHPKYGPVDWMTEEELNYVRGLYAGEVSFVDTWVGKLLEKIETLGLYQNSLIVFLSDHGHPHGDHGSILKTADSLYSELLRIPMLIHLPGEEGAEESRDALIQTHDLLPTLLDYAGLGVEAEAMHGRSLRPVIETGEGGDLRNYIIVGYHESPHRCVRDKEWSFILRPAGQENELYNLVKDPKEQHNVIRDHPDTAEELAAQLGLYFFNPLAWEEAISLQEQYEISGTPGEIKGAGALFQTLTRMQHRSTQPK
ncbi:MAG: sulfatase [Candidatus Bipolaricaulia bacterium]